MTQDNETFLRRWSRLKREEEKKASVPEKKEEGAAAAKPEAPPLPPPDSLTPKSDFSVFMNPAVQDSVRRVALKKLFADPHFNVPDLNEAYSGDWTGGEPISKELLDKLNQARTHLFSDEERRKLEELEAQAAQQQEQAAAGAPAEEKREDEPGRKDA